MTVQAVIRLFPVVCALALAGISSTAQADALQWSKQGDASGVVAYATTRAAPGEVFAAGDHLYLSSDGGASWQVINGIAGPFGAVAISPLSAATVLAGGPEGLLRSADAGHTWLRGAAGLPEPRITSLAMDFHAVGIAYAGLAHRGIWRSGDGGATWERAGDSPDLGVHQLLLDEAHANHILAATDQGIAYSADSGQSWKVVPLGPGQARALSITGEFVSSQAYAGTTAGVFRSLDGGRSWAPLSGPGAPGGTVGAVALHARSGLELVAANGNGVDLTVDQGNTWVPSPGWPGGAATALAYLELVDPVTLASSATSGGLLRIGEVVSSLAAGGGSPQPLPSITGKLHIDRHTYADEVDPLLIYGLIAAVAIAVLGAAAFWWRRRLAGF